MSLHGRIAVITGGASGIGLAISRRLAQGGASVAVFDDYAGAYRLVKQLSADGSSALAVEVDVSDRRQVDGAVGEVRNKLGPIQVLVKLRRNRGLRALPVHHRGKLGSHHGRQPQRNLQLYAGGR